MSQIEQIEDGFAVPLGHKSGVVAIIGRPNVGKSTLLNALLQQKIAIVTPRPQTTRMRQLGIMTTETYQIIFVDTPGMMKPRHKLDEFMMHTAVSALSEADIVLWLVDVSQPVGAGDQIIATQLQELPPAVRVILGLNKQDLLTEADATRQIEAYCALLPQVTWILFSATEGNGRQALLDLLVDTLPEGPRYYPEEQITDIFVRDIAAEMIREQILLQLRDEVPYGVAVKINEFKERPNGVAYINATIFTERENHKQILIGTEGKQLRELGAAARVAIEELVGGRVFLELWVKVEPRWRHDEKALKRLGYVSPD